MHWIVHEVAIRVRVVINVNLVAVAPIARPWVVVVEPKTAIPKAPIATVEHGTPDVEAVPITEVVAVPITVEVTTVEMIPVYGTSVVAPVTLEMPLWVVLVGNALMRLSVVAVLLVRAPLMSLTAVVRTLGG